MHNSSKIKRTVAKKKVVVVLQQQIPCDKKYNTIHILYKRD